MCGWMEIISQTLQGVVLPSPRWLLGNSILHSLSPGGNQVTPTYYHHVCCVLTAKTVFLVLLVANLNQLVFGWAPASPPRLAGVERLHQFIQQSPYAVVLLRGAGYGFVAHGADTAHLQPLYQTPVKKNRRDLKRGAKLSYQTHLKPVLMTHVQWLRKY